MFFMHQSGPKLGFPKEDEMKGYCDRRGCHEHLELGLLDRRNVPSNSSAHWASFSGYGAISFRALSFILSGFGEQGSRGRACYQGWMMIGGREECRVAVCGGDHGQRVGTMMVMDCRQAQDGQAGPWCLRSLRSSVG